jgi:hypothetical protein
VILGGGEGDLFYLSTDSVKFVGYNLKVLAVLYKICGYFHTKFHCLAPKVH